MTTYTLASVNNCIKPSVDNIISFEIKCGKPDPDAFIKHIAIDISALLDLINWSAVTPIMQYANGAKLDGGIITFQLDGSQSFLEEPPFNFTFSLEDVRLKSGIVLPPSVEIKFGLRPVSGDLINSEFEPSTIIINDKKPIIKNFRLYPSIIRRLQYVNLFIECEEIESYDIYYDVDKIIDRRFLPKISGGACKGVIVDKQVYDDYVSTFYLKAVNGDAVATENSVRKVKVISDSNWHKTALTEKVLVSPGVGSGKATYTDIDSDIVDLVLNEHEKMIWCFGKVRSSAESACLWHSEDGRDWTPYTIMDDTGGAVRFNKVPVSSDIVHCPTVHLGGLLYFVCGSKVDVDVCSNRIKVFDYAKNQWLTDIEGAPGMKARSMHACVVFPFNNIENIWVIGGADINGNGLSDIWRYDGRNWHEMKVPGFPKRCRFAATVQTDKDGVKKSIWIGGGVESYDGNTSSEIWKYEGSWTKIESVNEERNSVSPLKFTRNWLNASSLTCLVQDDSGNSIVAHDIYAVGRTKNMQYHKIIDEGNVEVTVGSVTRNIHSYKFNEDKPMALPDWQAIVNTADNFALATISFNGCVWLMAIVYRSEGVVQSSALFFSIP